MTIKRLVKLLIKHKIEFSFEYLDNEYYIDVILGNQEYIIHPTETDKLAQLWTEIETYWLY